MCVCVVGESFRSASLFCQGHRLVGRWKGDDWRMRVRKEGGGGGRGDQKKTGGRLRVSHSHMTKKTTRGGLEHDRAFRSIPSLFRLRVWSGGGRVCVCVCACVCT